MGEPKPIATIGVSLGNFYHQSWHSTPRPWSFAVRLTDSSCDFVLKFVSSGHWSICQWENPSDPSALTKGAGPDFANSIRNGKFTFWQIRDSGLVDVIDPNANDAHTHTHEKWAGHFVARKSTIKTRSSSDQKSCRQKACNLCCSWNAFPLDPTVVVSFTIPLNIC